MPDTSGGVPSAALRGGTSTRARRGTAFIVAAALLPMTSILIADPKDQTGTPRPVDGTGREQALPQPGAPGLVAGGAGFAGNLPLVQTREVRRLLPVPSRDPGNPLRALLELATRTDAGGVPPGPAAAASGERGLSVPIGAARPDPSVQPTDLAQGPGASGFRGRYVVPTPRPTPRPTPAPAVSRRTSTSGGRTSTSSSGTSSGGGGWRTTGASWYGPGFYGNGTACGQTYSRTIVGVAHRTLPCGTLVQFRWNGRVATAPVIDRGPYGVAGRDFDLSRALCVRLKHCHTGPIQWRFP